MAASLATTTPDASEQPPLAPLARRALRPGVVLAIASVGVFMAFMDDTVVGIAFPNLVRSFPGVSFASLSWILNGYYISFAALLIPAGRMADLIGRKRSFAIGIALFTLASAGCAAAPSVNALIAVRVLQGVGAAIIVPASLALVLEAHGAGDRAKAVGIWGATAALAAGIGPSIGGVLVVADDWRLVFLVNVPIGIAAWRLSSRQLVESRAPGRRELPDARGTLLLALALAAATVAIVQSSQWGWTSAGVIGAACASVFAGWLLVRRIRSHPSSVVDVELLRMPGVRMMSVITIVGSAGFFALGLANLLYLMDVWRYSPLTAGLATTPGPFAAAVAAVLAGRLAQRFDPRRMVLVGALIWTTGPLLLLWRMGTTPDFLGAYLPAALVLNVGVGIAFPLVSDAAVSGAPRGRFGGASALNGTVRQLGGTIGIAILAALIGSAAHVTSAGTLRRTWIVAAICYALVAIGSLAMRPFEVSSEVGDEDLLELRDRQRDRKRPGRPPARPSPGPAPPASLEELIGALPLFSTLTPQLLRSLTDAAETVHVRAGEWLFRHGDPGDAMYVVRSGRLEVMGEVVGRPQETMHELGPGSVVGELALLTGASRSASVRARRDAILMRLRKEAFDGLLREDAAFAQGLARVLGGELQRSRRLDEGAPGAATTVAVVSLSHEPAGIEDALVGELQRLCHTACLDADGLHATAGQEELGSALAQALDRLERDHRMVVLLAGQLGPGEWAQACVRQADRVLVLITKPHPEHAAPSPLLDGCDAALLVGAEEPGVAQLLDSIRPRSTQRIRSDEGRAHDVARLARRLTGRSVGLVLSGGGARAFAHIGVIEELLAAGITIDRVGGASTGAFVGALFAQGLDAAAIDAYCYEEWVRRNPLGDYRLPRVSLIRGARMATMLGRRMPGRIEDLPRSFYCVSTELLSGELVVHRRGELARAVAASMCLPGILPPVQIDGKLHVDGGVLDNLPVASMAAQHEGPVIACDVAQPEEGIGAEAPARDPSLLETLTRVLQLASADSLEQAREHADLVIRPAHESVGRLEFHAIDVMRESGRRAALAALEAAPSSLWP